MRIEQLMTKPARTCRPDQTLCEAAQMMWESGCGCLPVTPESGTQRLVGMITDRDISMAIRSQMPALGKLHVADAMAKDTRACNPGDPIGEVEAIIREIRVRRVPVVDESEQVIGLISLADLAREALRQTSSPNPDITQAAVGALLAAICAPRAQGGCTPPG